MRGCQSRIDHRLDLRAQLALDFGQLGLFEERSALRGGVDVKLVGLGSSNEHTSALSAVGPQRYSGTSRMRARWIPKGMCG